MHRIPLPLPNDALRAVNVYAIESGGDLVLVDAGWALAETGGLLDAALDRVGRNSAEITRCLVTLVAQGRLTRTRTDKLVSYGLPVPAAR